MISELTAVPFSMRLKTILVRRRASVHDAMFLLATFLVGLYVLYGFDIFENAADLPPRQEAIELDEALALGALICIGLLIFSGRRLAEQKRETTRRIAAERDARTLALHDALTGLPNRRQFDDALKVAIASPPRSGACHAVFLLDLNGFKKINDVYGHAAGDEVLIRVSGRFSKAMRDGDLVARFGGDEFAVLACQLSGPEEATSIALRIIERLKEPVVVGAVQHHVGTGIGISIIPMDGQTSDEVLRKADIALYRAKADGPASIRFFESEMDAHIRERDLLERELRAAIGSSAIRPYYQPLVDLKTSKIIGFEALARWTHAQLGEIDPERFISIAEDCGLISELTNLLLEQACNAAMSWPADTTLSFNISPVQLQDPTLGLRILAILGQTGLPPRRLELEITESALVRDLEASQRTLGALRETGIRIALDDFGTGYSSLYHLRNFKLDKIKIDRSFVEAMERDHDSDAIVRALIGLGAGLSLTVTAEGVETEEQQTRLTAQGCEQAQGFLFSHAVSAESALALFAGPERQRA